MAQLSLLFCYNNPIAVSKPSSNMVLGNASSWEVPHSWGCSRKEHPGDAKIVAGGLTRLALQSDRVTLHGRAVGLLFC